MKIIVNNYLYKNRNFTIVKHENHYCAIEDKYIGEDGRLNTPLNGLQMFASQTMNGCIEHLTQTIDIDELIASGCSKAEAMVKVLGLPEEMISALAAVI